MATGPLALPERRRTLIQPTAGFRAEGETASLWGQIAQLGQDIGQGVAETMRREEKQRIAGEVARLDMDFIKRQGEIAAKHPLDPDGFATEYQQYADGVLSSVAPEFVPHVRAQLMERQAQMVQTIAGERRVQARNNAASSYEARLSLAEQEALQAAGMGDQSALVQKAQTVADILDAGVAAGFYSADAATLKKTELLGKAQGERVLADVSAQYNALGAPAAQRYIEEQLGEGSALPVTPKEREEIKRRADGRLRELEDQAATTVLDWAASKDPLTSYYDLQGRRAPPEVMATYDRLSQEAKVKARRDMLSAASQSAQIEDRAERRAREQRERETNAIVLDVLNTPPTDPNYDRKLADSIAAVQARNEIAPSEFRQLQDLRRQGGVDDPLVVATLEDQVERGVLTNAAGLLAFSGRGLSYDTIRRLTTKLNQQGDERYKAGQERIRLSAGLGQGVLFNASSAEAAANARMQIAYADAVEEAARTAQEAGKPVPDPVAIAKQVIQADQAQRQQRMNLRDPRIQAAMEKLTTSRPVDASGNVVTIDFNDEQDVESAERLLDAKGNRLFSGEEIRGLRQAIKDRNK